MDTATIINRLLEDEIGSIDAKADFMRLRPEIRLLDRADKKDVILIDDHGPLYIGTVGPKGSWWRIAWLAPKSSGRVQRLELAKYYPSAEQAAEHLVNVMQPWWQTVLYRRAQNAYLTTESEDVDPKDYVMRAMTLRSLKDLQRQPNDQKYLCSDPQLIADYKLGGPFECWQPIWQGGGVVTIEFADMRAGYQCTTSTATQLRYLQPVDMRIQSKEEREAEDARFRGESEESPEDYIDRALTMHSPEDLKRRSKNQVYVCHDPELVRIYGEPVRCWKPVWKGDGMVEIRFDNKQPSNFVSKALVQLQHLTPYLNKSPDGEVTESWNDEEDPEAFIDRHLTDLKATPGHLIAAMKALGFTQVNVGEYGDSEPNLYLMGYGSPLSDNVFNDRDENRVAVRKELARGIRAGRAVVRKLVPDATDMSVVTATTDDDFIVYFRSKMFAYPPGRPRFVIEDLGDDSEKDYVLGTKFRPLYGVNEDGVYPLFGGLVTVNISTRPDGVVVGQITTNLPWQSSFGNVVYTTRCASVPQMVRRLSKKLEAQFGETWQEQARLGAELYASFSPLKSQAWSDYVEKHASHLESDYAKQTPETAAAWQKVKADYMRDTGLQEAWGDDKATIDAEAAKAEKPASKEQADAGNYKKGHVSVQGIPIAIENAKGSTRSGTNKKGEKWSVTMPAHYGYVKKSESKDGDPVDVYIGETPSSMLVFVINQKKEDSGAFDEHKCMLGFKTKDDAIAAYDSAFSGDLGPKLRGEVISCTIDQFKEWLDKGDTEKPFKLDESEEVDPTDFIAQNADAVKYDYLCQMCGHTKKLPFRDRTGRERTIYQVWCEQCQDTEYFEISDEELAERIRKERQEQEAKLTPEEKLARATAVMARRQQNESAVVIAKTLLDDE